MNKEISRSLVEFHFEPFQMSLMVVSISKIFKVKDTFQTTIFIQVKQKVLFVQGYSQGYSLDVSGLPRMLFWDGPGFPDTIVNVVNCRVYFLIQ